MNNDQYKERPIVAALSRLFDLLVLNALCFICCLPILTIGASISSMNYVMLKIVRETDDGIVKPFFRFFFQNLLKSLPSTLIAVVLAVLLLSNLMVMGEGNVFTAVFYGLSITGIALFIIILSWVFLLFAQFDNTVGGTFVNAVKLAVAHPNASFLFLLYNGIMILIYLISPEIFSYLFYLWVFFGIAASGYLSARQAVPVFNELAPELEPVPDPDLDREDEEEEDELPGI